MTLRTVRWEGATTAATLPAGDGALTAGALTPNTGVTLSAGTLTQYQPNEVWTVTHATARTTLSAAVTNGGYHSVTISRTGGMIPKAVRIKAARGGASSPRGFAIRSSVDSYTADLISVADVATQRATLTQYASADLTALGSQTSITFRIYHFAPTNSAAVDLDDLEVDYEDVAVARTGTATGTWTFTGSGVGAAPATISPATVLNVGTGTGQNHFELQMARSGDAAWTEITQAQISAGYDETPYFTTVRGGTAVQLSVPLDAPLVGTSAGPRAELREVNTDGSYAAYDINVGVHEVHGRSRVMSGTPDIVLAQFHNGTTDRITLRTQFVTSTLRLRARVNGSSIPTELASPYTVGTEFEWKIRVDNGAISIFFNDMVTPIYTAPAGTLVPTAGVSTWYFKSGAYAQATGAGTSSAVTELRDLSVTHTGVAAPAQGSATGSWSFAGSAVGKRTPKATATGSFTFAGSATGRRTPKAIGSGAWTFTGAAVGKRAPKATATGAATWSGTAIGRRVPKSTAVGTVTYTGTAVGLAPTVSDYHPHTPVTAILQFTPGTATLAGDGVVTADLAAQPPATAVITYTPGTAELHLT